MTRSTQNRKVGYTKWVAPHPSQGYIPRTYTTIKKVNNLTETALWEQSLQTTTVCVKLPISGSYTTSDGRKGFILDRMVSVVFRLQKVKAQCDVEFIKFVPALSEEHSLTLPPNRYQDGKFYVTETGTGDIMELVPEYSFYTYWTSTRIQSFLLKVARGGNRVLKPKGDWLMWEHCLTTFNADPDLMDANALNFCLHFMSYPLTTNFPFIKELGRFNYGT